jgi:hypothetical protein
MLTLNDSIIMNGELLGCLILEYVQADRAESSSVRLLLGWISSQDLLNTKKEADVVSSTVLFEQSQQNKTFALFSSFLNLQETQRKTKENTGRKHKKESTKEGRDETEIIERDAKKIRESIRDAQIASGSGRRCRVR